MMRMNFIMMPFRNPMATNQKLKIRSMVGLIPLLAVEVLEDELLNSQKEFTERLILVSQSPARTGQPGFEMG